MQGIPYPSDVLRKLDRAQNTMTFHKVPRRQTVASDLTRTLITFSSMLICPGPIFDRQ